MPTVSFRIAYKWSDQSGWKASFTWLMKSVKMVVLRHEGEQVEGWPVIPVHYHEANATAIKVWAPHLVIIKDVTRWIAVEKNPVAHLRYFRHLLVLRSKENLITKPYLSKMAHVSWSDWISCTTTAFGLAPGSTFTSSWIWTTQITNIVLSWSHTCNETCPHNQEDWKFEQLCDGIKGVLCSSLLLFDLFFQCGSSDFNMVFLIDRIIYKQRALTFLSRSLAATCDMRREVSRTKTWRFRQRVEKLDLCNWSKMCSWLNAYKSSKWEDLCRLGLEKLYPSSHGSLPSCSNRYSNS